MSNVISLTPGFSPVRAGPECQTVSTVFPALASRPASPPAPPGKWRAHHNFRTIEYAASRRDILIIARRFNAGIRRRREQVPSGRLNPNSEMGMAAVSKRGIIAMRCKAVLKHTQSKRWREVWCGPASAKRLDCVRFIAALSHSFLTRSGAKTLHDCPPASEFGLKRTASFSRPSGT